MKSAQSIRVLVMDKGRSKLQWLEMVKAGIASQPQSRISWQKSKLEILRVFPPDVSDNFQYFRVKLPGSLGRFPRFSILRFQAT